MKSSYKVLLFDFARVLLQPQFETMYSLGALYAQSTGQEPFLLNQELLSFVREQRAHYRTAILTNSVSILAPGTSYRQQMEKEFDQIFLSKELGLSKDLPACYMKVAELLGVATDEILFTDDKLSNCDAADTAGCHSIHFQTTEQYLQEAARLLS